MTIGLESCQAIMWSEVKSWAKNLFLSFHCPVLAIISNCPSMKTRGRNLLKKIFSLLFYLNILENFTEKPHPCCNERCGFPNTDVYRRQWSKGFHCLQGNRAFFLVTCDEFSTCLCWQRLSYSTMLFLFSSSVMKRKSNIIFHHLPAGLFRTWCLFNFNDEVVMLRQWQVRVQKHFTDQL